MRNGVNYLPFLTEEGWGEVGKSKVQRKPSGYAITQVIPYRYIIFPSKEKTLQTKLASDCESKMQRMAKKLKRRIKRQLSLKR